MTSVQSIDQPWEPISFWEHGKVTEKFLNSSFVGVYLAARIVEHIRDGVAWFVYEPDGTLLRRGFAYSIKEAQFLIDHGQEAHTDTPRRSA